MSILLALVGATVGAVIGSLFMHWRNDVAKERQQLESKTPYDYALTNAINERDRLQDELRTIQALKRTETDTERIRNEIGTILSDCGEEATEDEYGLYNVYREIEGVTKRWESNMKELTGGWDIPPAINTTDDKRHLAGIALGEWDEPYRSKFKQAIGRTSDGREYMDNVREDVTKGERLTGDGVERSYNHSVRQAFCDRTFVRVLCTGGMVAGEITTIAFEYGELTELQLNGIDVSIPEIIEIRKGDDISGETLYRKGNR